MDDQAVPSEELPIGEAARRVGVPVRTVRFWTDEGLVGEPARTAAGYRVYDRATVARLDLVRSLRELGLGLPAVRALMARRTTVAEVAAEHLRVLDAELRLLQLRRTLLRYVTTATTTAEELVLVHDLATLSARERQQMIDSFVERAFAGVPDDAPGAGLAAQMRSLPAELPADPSAEQVSAWLELARLVADDSFAERVRGMALDGAGATATEPDAVAVDAGRMQTLGRRALAEGLVPGTPRAEALVTELLGPDSDRDGLADQLERFTDARVERYWQLLGILNGWPAWEPAVPAVEWWIAALRAGARGTEVPAPEGMDR